MKIVGCISFYDEKPDMLAAAVASMGGFVDHVVAVDGAYMMYPGGKAKSPVGCIEAVRETAAATGMGCTVFEPQQRWAGNEVEKRAFLFRLAETATTDANDWYLILDGDELVTDEGEDVRRLLTRTEFDVAQVTSWQHRGHYKPEERPFVSDLVESQPVRKLFRAIPGLTVRTNHYTYVTPDGRRLWGYGDGTEPVLDLPKVMVEHRNNARDLWRADQAKRYYDRRDELRLEGDVPVD